MSTPRERERSSEGTGHGVTRRLWSSPIGPILLRRETERGGRTCCPCREREITGRDRARRHSTPMELADRPNLAPARDRGQRQRSEGGWVENLRGGFLKICDIPPFFLHCWRVGRVGAASEPCRRRVGACRRNEKKKKKRGHSPDTGIRRVVPVPVSDTCPTPTRRQKWRVRAT